MANEHVPSNDPLDPEAIDRDIRINELTEHARELGMGSSHVSDDCPPGVHEQFLRNMIDFETAPRSSQFSRLVEEGVALPAPETLDDGVLHSKLWVIINTLAARNTFVSHTDHLSDRQLYEQLWNDTLLEETTIMPPGSGWRNYIDMIGSGSEEDIEIGLRYYESEEDSQLWAKDFPKDVIPPHEDPPFDRDRLLPTPVDEFPEADVDTDE